MKIGGTEVFDKKYVLGGAAEIELSAETVGFYFKILEGMRSHRLL